MLDTRTELVENILQMGIGSLSIGLASRGTHLFVALSGFIYMLVGPVMTIHGLIMGKKRKRLEASLTTREQARTERATETNFTSATSG